MSRRVLFNPNLHLPQHVQHEAKEDPVTPNPTPEELPTVVKLPLEPSKPKVVASRPKVPPPPKIVKHLSPAQAIRNAQLKKKKARK